MPHKPKESQFSQLPLVYVVTVTVTLAFLGHFGQSRLTESIHLFPNYSHARLCFPPLRSAPSLNFYYSLTPYPSHRTRSHPLSGVLPSLVPYVTLFQSISSSLSLSLSPIHCSSEYFRPYKEAASPAHSHTGLNPFPTLLGWFMVHAIKHLYTRPSQKITSDALQPTTRWIYVIFWIQLYFANDSVKNL